MKAAKLHKKRFGKLTVIFKLSWRDRHGHVLWLCQCDCGNTVIGISANLNAGRKKSCGCGIARRGSNNHNWKAKIEVYCSHCGKSKFVKPSFAVYNNYFCNNDCKAKWQIVNLRGKNNPVWSSEKRACIICGEEVFRKKSQLKKNKDTLCGKRECLQKWVSLNCTGENNGKWKGTSPEHKLVCRRMTNNIRKALGKSKDGYSWEALLGYTRKQLFEHLEKTMPDGYTWDDLDELHIDHIIPSSAFNFDSYLDIDFKRCWALENLRLLPAVENMQKGASLESHFQPSLKLQLMQRSGKTILTEQLNH